MNRTAGKSVKWLVSVPESVNGAVRMHLAQSGGRKGDLSKFVVEAVEGEMARRTVVLVREGNARAGVEDVQRAVRAAVAVVRAERFTGVVRDPSPSGPVSGGSKSAVPFLSPSGT